MLFQLHQYCKTSSQQWSQSHNIWLICYSAHLYIDVHCSTHLKKKSNFLILLPIKIIKTQLSSLSPWTSPISLKLSSPSSHLFKLSVSAVPAHAVAVAPHHHSSFVHILASGKRHRRAPQEHEPAKRRRTGEENPLPEIGIVSMSQLILEVAVESETAGETERRSDEFASFA